MVFLITFCHIFAPEENGWAFKRFYYIFVLEVEVGFLQNDIHCEDVSYWIY